MSSQFPNLFSPIKIGPIVAPNRIVMSPHTTLFAKDRMLSDRYISYASERAKGGTGIIVTQMQLVLPNSEDFPGADMVVGEQLIPMYRKLADSVHRFGTKVFLQVNHAGRQCDSSFSRLPVWAPSAIPCPMIRETPKEMEIEDIEETIAAFGRTASYAKAAGLDGYEIHGMTGYLVQQFLSPFTNHRTDEYGGSVENRMRFLLRIVDVVRQNIGSGMALGIRLPGDEFVEGGLNLSDVKEIALQLEQTRKVDYLSISAGNYASIMTVIPRGMGAPLGVFVPLSAGIKEVVSIPVAVAGRIIDPGQAEEVISSGSADLVAMARALISDPEFAVKAKEGRVEDIRTCIGCNQGCYGRLFSNKSIACTQNAAVGYEQEMGIETIKPASSKKKVVVVGGGPAGLEAARIAAERGHHVTLFEKNNELGGQIRLAARVASREEISGMIRFLAGQVNKLGVELRTGVEATSETILQEGADVVVVATGSMPKRLPIPGASQPNVLTVWDVLDGSKEVGRKVLLIDDDGHFQSASTAEFVAERGSDVEIITRLLFVGYELPATMELGPLYYRLLSKGVKMTTNMMIREIDGSRVVAYNVWTKEERVIDHVDSVVFAVGNVAEDRLYKAIKGKVKELYRVGDCVAPRKAMDAIFDGNRIARMF